MRIFIGIPFSDDVNNYLEETQFNISQHAIKANLTDFRNFHLTLLYIGEMSQIQLEDLAYHLDFQVSKIRKFSIKFGQIGAFLKDKKQIIWLGIEQGVSELKKVHFEVKKAVKLSNIILQNPKFTPHVTLAREVCFDESFQGIKIDNYEKMIAVNKIVIFNSHRVDGNLTYTPLYHLNLMD